MKKEFVTYEQALALKELGFEETCFGRFMINNYDLLIAHTEKYFMNGVDRKEFFILSPLKQQAFNYFRNSHELSHTIELTDNSKTYHYEFFILDSKNREYHDEDCFDQATRLYNDLEFNSYEEAESACIDEMIKILKNK
jgi:hypothetical protein